MWSTALTVLLLLASLCQQPAVVRAEAPSRGGTLVVALAADPGHLNPALTTSGATHAAAELLYNGLLGRNEQGEPQPELAEHWEVEQAGVLYRFHLRAGVQWHDGQPFTAADVKFTFEQVLLKFHARTKASLGEALAAIDTPDAWTVVFRFTRPYAPLLQQLDVTEAPIPAPFTNAAAYRNPRVDALLEQAGRTVERQQRAHLYRQFQEIVVHDLPYYWLVETLSTRAWSARCGGFTPWTGLFAEAAWCRLEGAR
jgi:ABC-type transport system substrate-binding protein